MWVEFVVGSHPCSEGFRWVTPAGFPPSTKTNISKFQLDVECLSVVRLLIVNLVKQSRFIYLFLLLFFSQES